MDYTDGHGNPTPAALEKIKGWPSDREHWQRDLLAFVRSIWRPELGYGWRQIQHPGGDIEVVVTTNGCKENDELVTALQGHPVFWVTCSEWSRRSGAYAFRVR